MYFEIFGLPDKYVALTTKDMQRINEFDLTRKLSFKSNRDSKLINRSISLGLDVNKLKENVTLIHNSDGDTIVTSDKQIVLVDHFGTGARFNCYSASSFYGLEYTELDLEGTISVGDVFDNIKVSHYEMFAATRFTHINFGSYNFRTASELNAMFREVECLGDLDLRGLDFSNVITMENMFDLANIKTLYIGRNNTHKLNSIHGMFDSSRIQELIIEDFDTSHVTDFRYAFSSCRIRDKVDFSKLDVSSGLYMDDMFENSEFMDELDISTFKYNDAVSKDNMIRGVKSLGLKLGDNFSKEIGD